MLKNWLILGDEAFNCDETPMGVFRFTPEEMKDWQNIALKQLVNIVDNNEKVKEMVSGSNLISLRGLFYKKSEILVEHLNEFAKTIACEYDNLAFGDAVIDYDRRKDTNMLFISFFNHYPDPESIYSLGSVFRRYPLTNSGGTHSLDALLNSPYQWC